MTARKTSKPPKLPHQNINLLELVVVTVIGLVALVYGITALSSGDWGWFLPNKNFDAKPLRVELYRDGASTTFLPGDPAYDKFTALLNEQIRNLQGYWEVGLRDDVLADAFEKETTLVFVYATPIRLHTQWNIGTPNHFLVPVTGSYSNEQRVYIGTDGSYRRGAVAVTDLTALRQLARDTPMP